VCGPRAEPLLFHLDRGGLSVRLAPLGSVRLLWCGWGLVGRGSDLTGSGRAGKFDQVAPR
jgi:hypothetical protein